MERLEAISELSRFATDATKGQMVIIWLRRLGLRDTDRIMNFCHGWKICYGLIPASDELAGVLFMRRRTIRPAMPQLLPDYYQPWPHILASIQIQDIGETS